MKIWNGFCRGMKAVNKVSLYFGVLCLVFMAGLITVEIISRTVFNTSTQIADEYSGYMLCAVSFFGGAYALQNDSFLRVDILYVRFKGMTKRVMDIINWLVALVYSGFLLYFCWYVFSNSLARGTVSTAYSQTALVYPQSVMVIGCILLTLQILVELINAIFFYQNSEGGTEA